MITYTLFASKGWTDREVLLNDITIQQLIIETIDKRINDYDTFYLRASLGNRHFQKAFTSLQLSILKSEFIFHEIFKTMRLELIGN